MGTGWLTQQHHRCCGVQVQGLKCLGTELQSHRTLTKDEGDRQRAGWRAQAGRAKMYKSLSSSLLSTQHVHTAAAGERPSLKGFLSGRELLSSVGNMVSEEDDVVKKRHHGRRELASEERHHRQIKTNIGDRHLGEPGSLGLPHPNPQAQVHTCHTPCLPE